MEGILITWRELLVLVILVLAVYIAEMILLIRSGEPLRLRLPGQAQRQERTEHEQAIGRLEGRLMQLEEAVSALEVEVAQIKKSQATPYAQAVDMARMGRGPDEIAVSCGISRGEAELITAVHKAQSS